MSHAAAATWLLLAMLPGGTLDESVVLRDEYAPCGQVSLYLISQLRSIDATFQRIEELTGPTDADGCHRFADLSRAANKLGLHALALRVNADRLMSLPMPAIVHSHDPVAGPHLSVLVAARLDGAYILDAPYPTRRIPWSLFRQYWTGNILVFPVDQQQESRLKKRFESPALGRVRFWVAMADAALLCALAGAVVIARHRRKRDARAIAGTLKSSQTAPPLPTTMRADQIRGLTRSTSRASKRLLTVGAVVLVGLGGAVAAAAVFGTQLREFFSTDPRLEFEQGVVDLGEFAPGEHEIKVPLHNQGRKSLVISRVESSCSCAVVTKPASIAPFSTAEMRVTVQVGMGRGYANLTFQSNDPHGPSDLTLMWHGSAQPTLLPTRIAAVESPLGTPYERTISIVYPSGRVPVVPQLQRARCDAGNVHVDVLSNNPTAFRTASELSQNTTVGYLNLRVRVDSPEQRGSVSTQIELSVSYGKHEYKLTLPVSVHFFGPIVAEADSALFSAVTPSRLENQCRLIKLTGNEASSLEVARIPNWLRCELSPLNQGSSELRMTVTEAPPLSLATETVEIVSASDPNARFAIAVSAFIQTK